MNRVFTFTKIIYQKNSFKKKLRSLIKNSTIIFSQSSFFPELTDNHIMMLKNQNTKDKFYRIMT